MCIVVLFTIESSLSYLQQVIKRCRNHTEVHLASTLPPCMYGVFFRQIPPVAWRLGHDLLVIKPSRVTRKHWLNCFGCRRHRKTKEQRWLNSKILTSHPWLHERKGEIPCRIFEVWDESLNTRRNQPNNMAEAIGSLFRGTQVLLSTLTVLKKWRRQQRLHFRADKLKSTLETTCS